MKPESMDGVFHALANRTRRQILDIVKKNPGCSVNDVCRGFSISRIAIMRHLDVLRDAGLLISEKEGRTRQMFFNTVPIQLIYDRWNTEFSRLWANQVTQIKHRAEKAS